MKARVAELSAVFTGEQELIDAGFTHTVYVGDRFDLEDIVDFRNEFAARTYADAINMGLAV